MSQEKMLEMQRQEEVSAARSYFKFNVSCSYRRREQEFGYRQLGGRSYIRGTGKEYGEGNEHQTRKGYW